ncbi:MAG: hypothetical protein KJ597_07335 [Nanoarchaeota archaeon]|nr:hypothetical protein [Nanoarchaeota archaeon]MBU1623357.1 hypothetical protein [Nanoarchaeota archaeon]
MNLIKEKLQQLATETDAVKKSTVFKQYLDTMAKFWEYSYHNQLLIHFAMPSATRVAGFKAWQELGRQVKKGSKSIKILAPFKSKEDDDEVVSFFPVSVFDVSQTEGAELPSIDIKLEGDDQESLLGYLEEFCSVKGIELKYQDLGVNGVYGYSKGGSIVVGSGDSVNMRVNTLVHEIAHELLHRNSKSSKKQKEIQAESVAYVVCKHFGLETKSFTYLALHGASSEEIMENLSAISGTVKEVIEFVCFIS